MPNHFYRGRGYLGGVCKKPQILGVQEERSYMSLRGERHVHIWSYLIAYINYVFFYFPYLIPISHARFRGSKTSKGRKSLILWHMFTFGDMSIPNGVLSTHSIHVIPVLVLLWFLLFALASRCICVV